MRPPPGWHESMPLAQSATGVIIALFLSDARIISLCVFHTALTLCV